MRPINVARPAPAATGDEPRTTDRHSGAIGSQNNTTQHPAPTAVAFHDWWRGDVSASPLDVLLNLLAGQGAGTR
jgi:hypothetical protein